MKTTAEMIVVMEGWTQGKEIQQKRLEGFDGPYIWIPASYDEAGRPEWNWETFDYRIKPEPKVGYVNEYPPEHEWSCIGNMHPTPEKAREEAGKDATRIAVKYIEEIK